MSLEEKEENEYKKTEIDEYCEDEEYEEEREDKEFDVYSYILKESRKRKFKNTIQQTLSIKNIYLKEADSKEKLSDEEIKSLFISIEEIKKENPFNKEKIISDIKNKIIESHLRYVMMIVKRFYRSIKIELNDIDFLSLIQVGNIGLLDAVEKFDVFKNYNFKTYAEYRIKGSVLDELRALDWFSRNIRKKVNFFKKTRDKLEQEKGAKVDLTELAAFTGIEFSEFLSEFYVYDNIAMISLEEIRKKIFKNDDYYDDNDCINIDYNINDEYAENPDSAVFKKQLQEKVLKLIYNLLPQKRNIIDLYYFQNLTMKEIGKITNLTEGRVSQLHKKIMAEIRKKCKKEDIL